MMADDGVIDDDLTLTTGAISYAQAWELLLDDQRLSDGAVRLYLLLSTYTRPKRPVAFPGQETLAERMGVSVDTIGRRLGELEEAKWIAVKQRGRGRTSLIHIKVPGGSPPPWEPRHRKSAESCEESRHRTVAESRTRKSAESIPNTEVDEVEVEAPSSSLLSDVDDPDDELLLADATTSTATPPPTPAPRRKQYAGPTLPKWVLDGMAETIPLTEARSAMGIPPKPEPATPPEGAPSTGEDRSRHNVIRRPEGLARALRNAYEFDAATQADHRNLAKLLDLKPTLAQLDGAIEALGWMKGAKLDLGRLVTKWATLSQFGAKRPASWNTKRTKQADAIEAHEAAGGNRHMMDGSVDYGI